MRQMCNVGFAMLMKRCAEPEDRDELLFELRAPLDPLEQSVLHDKMWDRRGHPG